MSERVTLIIPTLNRPDFLSRALHYYQDLGFRGQILVGDSSQSPPADRTWRVVESLRDRLEVTYRDCRELSYSACFKTLGKSVTTSYTAFVGDDDFLVPNGVARCVTFLDAHPDYTAAHGIAVMFQLEVPGPHGGIRSVRKYPQRGVEGESATARLLDYLNQPFTPLFSVHRTEAWQRMCPDGMPLPDRPLADEGLPSFLSVVQGKIKELDCLYLAFQGHDRRTKHPDIFDRITSPTWALSYQMLRDALAEELAKRDGIDLEEARELLKRGFWRLLERNLSANWVAKYTPPIPGRLSGIARRLPGVLIAWRAARSLMERSKGVISLSTLLWRSSRYHADFMPIYRAVMAPPPEV